jgi:sporulation protein YlmC with PRC-barrel domain
MTSSSATFSIGTSVSCSDGHCGELRRVVIDPAARTLTHLVVEPKHRKSSGHLVPVDLVESSSDGIRLRCTLAEFNALEEAEETQLLSGLDEGWAVGMEPTLSDPSRIRALGYDTGPRPVVNDRVPEGEVEVRPGEHVHATDGEIGRVHGFVIDPDDDRVTHVLLAEGHLWGHKQVAIPISAVVSVEDGVSVNLTKDQVRDLPPVQLA